MDKLNINTNYKTPSDFTSIGDLKTLPAEVKQLIYDLQKDYSQMSERINWLLDRLNKGDTVTGTFTIGATTYTITNGVITGIA